MYTCVYIRYIYIYIYIDVCVDVYIYIYIYPTRVIQILSMYKYIIRLFFLMSRCMTPPTDSVFFFCPGHWAKLRQPRCREVDWKYAAEL